MCKKLLVTLWESLVYFFWGPWNSLKHTFSGYWRPYPGDSDYNKYPYSVWRGIFLGYVWELAGEKLGTDPASHVAHAVPANLFNTTAYQDGKPVMRCTGVAGPGTVLLASNDSNAEQLGITRAILQQAGKETRDRLTSELSVMMTVCTFIGGFVFTTLVNRSLPSQMATSPPASFNVFGFLAGLCFIIAVIAVGLYARMIVLLQWSATSTSLYRVICKWERAMSGNQLMFLLVITLALASALSACWDRYAHWVFVALVICTCVPWWFFMYFWSKSMSSPKYGVMYEFPRLYYNRLLNDNKAFDSLCCQKFHDVSASIQTTFYGLVDGYLQAGAPWAAAAAGSVDGCLECVLCV